jgi:hypothetical protein
VNLWTGLESKNSYFLFRKEGTPKPFSDSKIHILYMEGGKFILISPHWLLVPEESISSFDHLFNLWWLHSLIQCLSLPPYPGTKLERELPAPEELNFFLTSWFRAVRSNLIRRIGGREILISRQNILSLLIEIDR